jgi:Glycosyl hydrolase-like 10
MQKNKLYFGTILLLISILLLPGCTGQASKTNPAARSEQNWTHFVRTAGHGLSVAIVPEIIKDAQETNLFGIETDNDIPGRYESYLDPAEKLAAIKAMADAAHAINNYAYVYIAGLECITANADKSEHTFFKDHPDWVQRKITGEPAIFGGGTAFWIDQGDEDVWISPYAPEWRKIYMERVRQIAATGIDGVYVDIPYWMTHFDGWEDSWASFDDYTVAAFKKETGLDAKKDLKLGDFNDPNFRKWIDFRINTLTAFMKEIDDNVKAANPKCMTIPEIYPGYGEEAVRVGADVYDMYPAVDVIAHEYSAGGSSSTRNPSSWFTYMTGMYSFRAFAEGKASWMLSYSWDKSRNIKVDPTEAMKNLALAQVMAGANFWDAEGHVMSGSNDYPTRKVIMDWIAANEKSLYLPRQPIKPVGIYFSNKTRNYFANEFNKEYTGMMHLLLQAHQEFQIVIPRTLANFTGQVLILPDVKCLSSAEISALQNFKQKGGKLFVTGQGGAFDETGKGRQDNPLLSMLNVNDISKRSAVDGEYIYDPMTVGTAYFETVRQGFDSTAWNGASNDKLEKMRNEFLSDLTNVLKFKPAIQMTASPYMTAQPALVNGKIHIFMANYKGLKGREVVKQIAESGVEVKITTAAVNKIYFLPYLGSKQELNGINADGIVTIKLPDIDKGAILWIE